MPEATVGDMPGLNLRFGPFKILIASIQRKMLLKSIFVRLDNHRLENHLKKILRTRDKKKVNGEEEME